MLVETSSNLFPSLSPCSVNSNLDLIVSATDLLKALHVSPGAAMTHPHLSSLEDLQELVSYSMQHCAGTERFFTSQEVFEQTVQAAITVNHKVGDVAGGAEPWQSVVELIVPSPSPLSFPSSLSSQYHIGGNAALIAETIQQSEPNAQVSCGTLVHWLLTPCGLPVRISVCTWAYLRLLLSSLAV